HQIVVHLEAVVIGEAIHAPDVGQVDELQLITQEPADVGDALPRHEDGLLVRILEHILDVIAELLAKCFDDFRDPGGRLSMRIRLLASRLVDGRKEELQRLARELAFDARSGISEVSAHQENSGAIFRTRRVGSRSSADRSSWRRSPTPWSSTTEYVFRIFSWMSMRA